MATAEIEVSLMMPNVKVTGAARFYRAASEWTAGLDFSCAAPHFLLD